MSLRLDPSSRKLHQSTPKNKNLIIPRYADSYHAPLHNRNHSHVLRHDSPYTLYIGRDLNPFRSVYTIGITPTFRTTPHDLNPAVQRRGYGPLRGGEFRRYSVDEERRNQNEMYDRGRLIGRSNVSLQSNEIYPARFTKVPPRLTLDSRRCQHKV